MVYEPTLDEFILELKPNAPQLAAIEQARVALETLIETNIIDEAELQVAITDVVEASACLRARFSGSRPDVPLLISQFALSSTANRLKADAAFQAFQRSQGRPSLAELEPEGSGCLDDYEEAPASTDAPIAQGEEEFIDDNGEVVEPPQAEPASIEPDELTADEIAEDDAAMLAAQQEEAAAPAYQTEQAPLKPLQEFTVRQQ